MAFCLRYQRPSTDFTLDENARTELAATLRSPQHDFPGSYVPSGGRASSSGAVTTDQLITISDDRELTILLEDLRCGPTITITAGNAEHLREFAQSRGIDSLYREALKYTPTCNSPALSILLRIRDFFVAFFGGFGFFGRVIFTFWDLFGALVVTSCVLNLCIELTTMGLYKVANESVLCILLLIPYCFYLPTFGNMMAIPTLEFLSFRILRAGETFFPTHQRLLLSFLRVTPLRVTRTALFASGRYYDAILGVIFVAFGLSIVWQFKFAPRISQGQEGFLLIFAIGIPPIKYILLYVLYALHSFASLLPSCRAKFLADGVFDDPYLCTIYFGRTPWRHLYRHWRGERTQSTLACVVHALFSKTTAAFYFTIATASFLISQHSRLTAAEAFAFVFLVFCLVIPLCSTISFPSFILAAFRPSAPTDNEVRREFASISTSDAPREVFFRYVAYARQHQALRSIVLFATGVAILFAVVGFSVASGPESASKFKPIPVYHARPLADQRHRVTHAICDATVKTLTMFQVGILEQLSETPPNGEDYNHTVDLVAGIMGWENLTNFEIVDAPFPDEKLGSYLKHFIVGDRGLHVFAVCGTKNFLDFLVDVELWASGVLWSLFQRCVPLLSAFSHIGRDYMAKLMALPRNVFRPLSVADEYLARIEAYIRSVPIGENEDALITGHSLGGGVAKILALKTGYATVAWSGPGASGLVGVYGGFETRPHIISITPEQDGVAAIDPSDGTTFKLPCRAGAMYCHDLKRMLCQMGTMCGTFEQVRPRCEAWFTKEMIDDMFNFATPIYIG
jgi:hypothetical protein